MPAIPFHSGIDLNKTGRIHQGGWETLPSPPQNPFAGQEYYDSTLKKVGFWNGTKWIYGVDFSAGTGISIANDTISINNSEVPLFSDLGAVATSNSYTDLDNKPTIPTVNNPTITIQKNSTTIKSFNLNQSNSDTINITVPTQASDVDALPASTTINDLTTTSQQQALNSGINTSLVSQISTNQSNITTINGKIPAEATSTNKLADKAYVDNAIQTNSAHFRGNWSTWASVPTNVADYPADDDGNKTPTTNDYMIVQDASDYTGDTLVGAWQFTYTGTWATNGKSGWLPRFQINENPLTPTQQAALDSGITSTLVTQISTNETNIGTLQTQIATKAEAFAVTNPALSVSGGICTWTFNNTIGTKNIQVNIWREVDGVEIRTYVKATASQITISFNSTANINAGTYRAVVTGLK